MRKDSPTSRTLRNLRERGYTAQVVEKFNVFAHVRIDLFGCIDVVGIKEGENGVLGVQTTSSSHVSEHIKKVLAIPEIITWLKCGNRLLVQGWRKNSKRHWVSKEIEITLSDFEV